MGDGLRHSTIICAHCGCEIGTPPDGIRSWIATVSHDPNLSKNYHKQCYRAAIADTHRMAETGNTDSVRSMGSGGGTANRQDEITALQQRVKQLEEGLRKIRRISIKAGTPIVLLADVAEQARSILSDKGED